MTTVCRICKSKKIYKFLSLGKQPLANSFISKEDLSKKELMYPLTLCLCRECLLVQLKEVIPGKLMFKNYLYIPSSSKTRINHFYELAKLLTEKLKTSSKDLAVDIGSNDGSLLECFMQFGVKILGVDPSENLAKVAELKGIHTVNTFFTSKAAKKIVKEYGKARIITATNVFAHIDNLHEFIKGIEILLADNGIFAIEFPYLIDFLQNCEFDTIYHEHLSYFSIHPLLRLFSKTSLEIYDIEHMDLDGGSVRVFVRKKKKNDQAYPQIEKFLKLESDYKLNTLDPYEKFAKRVIDRKNKFKKILNEIKKKKKKVIGYGAPAKGNTFLNYCKITKKDLLYIVDSTPYKQGLFLPGSHIPIYHENKIVSDVPDYIVILAWNFADEILNKNAAMKKLGVRFILPHKDFLIV